MKFLLTAINAKYIHSNPAIYSLRSYAGNRWRQNIELAEYTINNRMDQILSDIYNRQPDVIGFSCYIWNWRMIGELITELHKLLPDLPIWLGGPEVSYECQQILEKYPFLAGIMLGEGEETFVHLLEYYNGERASLQSVSGIATTEGVMDCSNLVDLNKVPFFYTDLTEAEAQSQENRILYYESSRGCPFRCSYCLSSIDKRVRLRDLELVKKELQFFLDKKVPQVKFIDRTFNCNHKHAQEIWKYILENDNGITNFHFEISADLITDDELQILSHMRPGLVQLEIGVQTTNQETLQAINRSNQLERLKAVVEKIYSYGNIHQHLDLIAGLPYEDLESFRKSFDDVYRMRPQQLQLGFLKVLKGSEMYRKAKEYGIVYGENPPYEVMYTNWLSYKDVQELKKIEEMVELFYNSNQFVHTITVLQQLYDNAFDLYKELADFFEEKNYFINAPARSYRYHVLLQFCVWKSAKHESLWKELLTFDLYLRENAKSRPDFCLDMSPYKQQIQTYYKKEVENPVLLQEYVKEGRDSKAMYRMTHMEAFHYPVWEKAQLSGILEHKKSEPQFVLFDYTKRNPLTYDATFFPIDNLMI